MNIYWGKEAGKELYSNDNWGKELYSNDKIIIIKIK